MSICSCSMQSVSVLPRASVAGCSVNTCAWMCPCGIRWSGSPFTRSARPPARPPAVQRQLARLRGKIQKFNIKRKLRPSSLHLHHCAVLEEADEYKTKKRKGKEKDARNVQKCSFFSINTHFLILYFFVKWCIASFPSKASVLGFFNPSFIHSFTSQTICLFIVSFYRLLTHHLTYMKIQ